MQPSSSGAACEPLQQLAASHAALRAGQVRSVTSLDTFSGAGWWTRTDDGRPGPLPQLGTTPDSSGTRVVSMDEDSLQVRQACSIAAGSRRAGLSACFPACRCMRWWDQAQSWSTCSA